MTTDLQLVYYVPRPKGTISEFKLVTMRNRLERGRLHKAQRSELFHRVPTGYIKLSSDRVELDPDAQVREVVRIIFDKYDELGTAWGVFHYLVRNNIRLGFRPFHGPHRGELEWRRPALLTIFPILRHPIYAGAYTYGRRPHQRIRTAAAERTTVGPGVPMDPWKVLKLDCLPAYITWDRYLANPESLHQHRSGPGSKGRPRDGAALRAGIVVCGNCGRCFQTSYRHQGKPDYSCVRHLHEGTEQVCFGLKATPVNDLVAQQVLRALEPAALELSCRAMEDIPRDRARLDEHGRQRLERAAVRRRGCPTALPGRGFGESSRGPIARAAVGRNPPCRATGPRRLRPFPSRAAPRASRRRSGLGSRSSPATSPRSGTPPARPTRIARSSSGTWWRRSWST